MAETATGTDFDDTKDKPRWQTTAGSWLWTSPTRPPVDSMPIMKGWSLFLIGVGVGVMAGVQAGEPATLPALVAVVGGLLLLAVNARSRTRDLVRDATAARTATAGTDTAPEAARDRPSLRGLGSRVEGILKLAEEQAADRIAEAEVTAAKIVAQARAEAERTTTTE